jgi:exodeoxyribonuclease VII large subunit
MVVLNSPNIQTNAPEFSVSELSGAIKRSLEQGFSHVRVRGECGRVTIPKSGHIYLDLKDKDAVINGIIWKGVASGLKIKPEEGLEVIATGKITTFAGQSKYQIIIESLEPAGLGAILLQLEERKKRLAAEGLFAQERKKKIPYLPQVIGVITSPTGAVIRDILHRISDRFPRHVLLWRVLVQGDKAAEQIVHAIEGFNAIDGLGDVPRPDVLIVARGGGSVEDLWCFNDENVVRAAANSKIPLISAVGHETDTTLIDFAADLRAPTPTGAAEMAVPVRNELYAKIQNLGARFFSSIVQMQEKANLRFGLVASKFPKAQNLFLAINQKLDVIELRLNPLIKAQLQKSKNSLENIGTKFTPKLLQTNIQIKSNQLNEYANRLLIAKVNLINQHKERNSHNTKRLENSFARFINAQNVNIAKQGAKLSALSAILNTLDYHRTLERGFAIVRGKDGKIINNKDQALKSANLAVTFKDGEINVQIAKKSPIQGDLF